MAQERDDDRDSRSQRSDSAAAPALRRSTQPKTSAGQARVQAQPYSVAQALRPSDLLSCSECRKRKTKCDRQTPCSGCIQRGKPDLCNPDVRRYPPAAGKLSEEVADLRDHVRMLEGFLASKFPEYTSTATGENEINILAAALQPAPASVNNENATHNIQEISQSAPLVFPGSATNTDIAAASTSFGSEMPTERNDQSMASILARFRDSEILGDDKGALTINGISPSSANSSLHTQLFPLDSAPWPTIRLQAQSGPNRLRMQLFFTSLLGQVPSPAYCHQYVEAYFKHTAWEIFAVLRKQILSELTEFETLRLQGGAAEVDPAWLAILLIVISMGLLTTYHSPRSQWEEETDIDYSRASTHYAELSRAALELADWTTSPSIRVLQAVLVTGWRYHHLDARSSSFDGPGRSRLAYRTLLHIAYEHCCALGIDTLQIDPNATIAADAFHPNSTPAMRREFGLRLWFSYLCVETLLSDHQIHRRGPITQSILPGMYTEDDLTSSRDVPERSFTDHGSLLYLHLQEVIFGQLWQQSRLAERGASWSEITPAMEVYQGQLDIILVGLANVKNIMIPSPLGSYQGLINAIKMFKASATLRIYRPALLSMKITHESDLVKSATAEATTVASIAFLPETKQTMLCFPPAISFLYNAATLLLVTLCLEVEEDVATTRTALLQSSLRLLQAVQAETKSTAIASNAKKSYDALVKLGRALLQEGQNLTYMARQRLETILAPSEFPWTGPTFGQQPSTLQNNYDFIFPANTWGGIDQTTLTPAIWPDSFVADRMAMTTDIDGWLKWLDAA